MITSPATKPVVVICLLDWYNLWWVKFFAWVLMMGWIGPLRGHRIGWSDVALCRYIFKSPITKNLRIWSFIFKKIKWPKQLVFFQKICKYFPSALKINCQKKWKKNGKIGFGPGQRKFLFYFLFIFSFKQVFKTNCLHIFG